MRKESIAILSLLFAVCSCSGGADGAQADGAVSVSSRSGFSGGEGNSGKWVFLAGGCFWGVEKYLALIPGVIQTEVGYANGRTQFPSYEDVCYRNTGHAETVLVEYDPARLELSFLLDQFYKVIDPTSLNRQGNDAGTQYRTGIYYSDEADLAVIEASISALGKVTPKPVVVEVKALENYYAAEDYHQKYLDKNPYGYCHISNDKFEAAKNLNL